ncbi:MAG: GNAT family N-acetyltransferase [Candidatus Methanomethylophilaceae archaeon]|nr:GNAT family N-acetyltransferase [Candidatus Methanomethylophilaceae archaeon]MDD4244995.1 GNAT family N-acetyltransferase [Candidatus Methanomethylophilaceae archaeon]MDD4454775.1 GNAT family N-acetyltransferase [Candidatus Methanomethylophilaceae archaeon]
MSGDRESAKEIAELAKEIWAECFGSILPPGQTEYMIEKFQSEKAILRQMSEGYIYDTIFFGERNVGYSAIKVEEDRVFISKIYLLKSFRGRGLAYERFQEIEAIARDLGKPNLYLTVNRNNESAIRFYRSMGFFVDDEVDKDIGGRFFMNDYIMRKLL